MMVVFDKLESADGDDARVALDIYDAAFPASERIPRQTVAQRIDRGVYELWIGRQPEDRRVVFMAILYTLHDSDLVLLGYIATHADFRNQGIGSAFFRDLLQQLQARDRYLLIEMEVPDDRDPFTQRRHQFYQRLGANVLQDVRYILPPLSGGEPTEMWLAIAPAYKTPTLTGDRVRQLLEQLYTEVYERPHDEPLLRTCLASVPPVVRLR